MSQAVRLLYAVIATNDLARSAQFYTEVMGLERLGPPLDRPDLVCVAGGPDPARRTCLLFIPAVGTDLRSATARAVASLVLKTAPATLHLWAARLARKGSRMIGRAWAFDQAHLCFRDPDLLDLSLVEEASLAGQTASDVALTCQLSAVEVPVRSEPARVKALVQALGYRPIGQQGPMIRFETAPADVRIDLLHQPDASRRQGSGGLERLVIQVRDPATLETMAAAAAALRFVVRKTLQGTSIDLAEQCDLEIELSAGPTVRWEGI